LPSWTLSQGRGSARPALGLGCSTARFTGSAIEIDWYRTPDEGAGVAEAADVTGLGDDRGGEVGAGAVEVLERVADVGQEVGDLDVQGVDAVVEIVDVCGELTDAARGGALREAVAELMRLSLRSSR
jgi:hypothetical protein